MAKEEEIESPEEPLEVEDEDDDDDDDEENEEKYEDEANQWYRQIRPAWVQSAVYQNLPQYTWNVRGEIPEMVVDLSHCYHDVLPADWTWEVVEDSLLNLFPRRVSAPKYYFKAIGRVMEQFCQFLSNDLRMSHLTQFSPEIRALQGKIETNAKDFDSMGLAKTFLQGGLSNNRRNHLS